MTYLKSRWTRIVLLLAALNIALFGTFAVRALFRLYSLLILIPWSMISSFARPISQPGQMLYLGGLPKSEEAAHAA